MKQPTTLAAINLHRIHVFCSVADHKGYAPVARVLGIDERQLGQEAIKLEKSLGVRLIDRSTYSKGLTRQGKACYGHMAPLLGRLQVAIEECASASAELEHGEGCERAP